MTDALAKYVKKTYTGWRAFTTDKTATPNHLRVLLPKPKPPTDPQPPAAA